MKKSLFLPLLVATTLVSQAWAQQDWVTCTGQYAGYCKWSLTGTGCDQISSGPPPDGKATCELAYKNCKDNGYIFTNAACTVWAQDGNDPTFNNGVPLWCKWATSCHPIKSATELTSCKTNGSVFSGVPSTGVGEGKTCAGGTWTSEGKNPNATQLGCCRWSSSTTNPDNLCWPIMSDDPEGGTSQVGKCKSGSNTYWDGSSVTCGEGTGVCPTTTPTYPISSISSSSTTSSSSPSSGTSSSSVGSSSSGSNSSSSGDDDGNSSSSEDDDTPIVSRSPLAPSQSPITYYTLKGEPLGNAKPQKAGVYIVKQQGSPIKKIVVR